MNGWMDGWIDKHSQQGHDVNLIGSQDAETRRWRQSVIFFVCFLLLIRFTPYPVEPLNELHHRKTVYPDQNGRMCILVYNNVFAHNSGLLPMTILWKREFPH